MAQLKAGDKAPTFRLATDDGGKVALGDYRGKRVVVYFYPADDTPGCTKEACQFSDLHEEFKGRGTEVIGISPDDAASHRKFKDKHGLRVVLASDPTHEVMAAYGAWGEKTLYGKKTIGVIRSTFVIDTTGHVKKAWYGVRADGHAAKVLETLSA